MVVISLRTVKITFIVLAVISFVIGVATIPDDKLLENAEQECTVHPGNVTYIKDMGVYICQH
jgi:hypothetical protein